MKSLFNRRRKELCLNNLFPLRPENFVPLFLCYFRCIHLVNPLLKLQFKKYTMTFVICGCFEVKLTLLAEKLLQLTYLLYDSCHVQFLDFTYLSVFMYVILLVSHMDHLCPWVTLKVNIFRSYFIFCIIFSLIFFFSILLFTLILSSILFLVLFYLLYYFLVLFYLLYYFQSYLIFYITFQSYFIFYIIFQSF